MRMASPTQMEATFVNDMREATRGQCDEAYFTRLAADAPATVKWIAQHDIEFIQPTYYLAKGPPRIQPSGGGPTLIKQLTRAARQAGVAFRYGCTAGELVTDDNRISGLTVEQDSAREMLPADAVVLACGGFQGNREMMRSHFGSAVSNHAVDFARISFQLRRRRTHRGATWSRPFRRLERHARGAG